MNEVVKDITRHFSGGEGPWRFREGSVEGGVHAVAPAEFFVRQNWAMGIIKQNRVYYIKSLNAIDDIKILNEVFYRNFRRIFSEIRVSDNAIVLNNSLFNQIFSWGYLKIISSGELISKPQKNYFILTSSICFQRFIYINLLLILLILISLLSDSEMLFMGVVAIVFISVTFISLQIAAIKFDSLLTKCIKESGLMAE